MAIWWLEPKGLNAALLTGQKLPNRVHRLINMVYMGTKIVVGSVVNYVLWQPILRHTDISSGVTCQQTNRVLKKKSWITHTPLMHTYIHIHTPMHTYYTHRTRLSSESFAARYRVDAGPLSSSFTRSDVALWWHTEGRVVYRGRHLFVAWW